MPTGPLNISGPRNTRHETAPVSGVVFFAKSQQKLTERKPKLCQDTRPTARASRQPKQRRNFVTAMQLIKCYASPFGRCNRVGLLRVTLIMLAAQAAIFALIWASGTTLALFEVAAKVIFFWIGSCAMVKRLHDIGRSGWWIPGFVLALIVWSFVQTVALLLILGTVAFDQPELIMGASVLATVTPVLAATIWLHYAPGDPAPNRYGPVPEHHGLSSSSNVHLKKAAQTWQQPSRT